MRRANDDAAQLRATVERLKSELHSIKAAKAGNGTGLGVGGIVGVGGEGFGSSGGNVGIPFGAAAAAPVGGPPWAAGGMRQGIGALVVVFRSFVFALLSYSRWACGATSKFLQEA